MTEKKKRTPEELAALMKFWSAFQNALEELEALLWCHATNSLDVEEANQISDLIEHVPEVREMYENIKKQIANAPEGGSE